MQTFWGKIGNIQVVITTSTTDIHREQTRDKLLRSLNGCACRRHQLDGQKCVCLDASSHSFRGSISRLNNTQHRYNENKHLYSSIKEVSKVAVPSRTSLRKVRLKYTIWVWRLQLRMLCIVRLSRFWGSTRLGWSLPVLCAPRHPQMQGHTKNMLPSWETPTAVHVKAIAVCAEES